MINLKAKCLIGLSALVAVTPTVVAQGYYSDVNDDRYYDGAALVTVYEDCNFRGDSQVVDFGSYSSMRALRFGNDKMSSIRVPEGTQVTIYEDDDFRGAFAIVDRDVACFDRTWNDKVSSLRVNASDNDRRSRDSRYDDRGREDREYRGDNRGRNGDRNRNSNRNANRGNDNVTGKNVSQVVFGSSVLQQTSRDQWQLTNPRSGTAQYREISRDQNTVYLQNDYTAQKIRVDLFTNDVTFVNRTGQTQRYTIDRREASLASARPQLRDRPVASNGGQNRTIRRDCFTFRAYTKGGNGGLRFHGKDKFYRFTKRAESDRVCHNGSLTMEINKTDPNTDVIVEIEGNRYRFAPNEKEDAYKNTWYRKKITLRVGR